MGDLVQPDAPESKCIVRSYGISNRYQSGIALFMSLVMLLIITVLGLSSVQSTSMQERMARNSRDTNLAFQSAEAAIKDAEAAMSDFSGANLVAFEQGNANSQGLYREQGYTAAPNWQGVDWGADSDKKFITAPTEILGVAQPAKYIIEHVKTVLSNDDQLNLNNVGQDTGAGRTHMFRVTVYATGGTDTAHVVIQSTYGKRF